MNHIKISDLCN